MADIAASRRMATDLTTGLVLLLFRANKPVKQMLIPLYYAILTVVIGKIIHGSLYYKGSTNQEVGGKIKMGSSIWGCCNRWLLYSQFYGMHSLVPRLHSPASLTWCEKSWGVEPGNEAIVCTYMYRFATIKHISAWSLLP